MNFSSANMAPDLFISPRPESEQILSECLLCWLVGAQGEVSWEVWRLRPKNSFPRALAVNIKEGETEGN